MRAKVAVLVGSAVALGALAAAAPTVDVKRPASRDARVSIENGAGSVAVVGWDRDEVAVSGTLCDRAESLEFGGPPHTITIGIDVRGNPHACPSQIEVKVPAGSRVDVETHSAAITAMNLTGTFRAESVLGPITVNGSLKEVEVSSVSGGVTVQAGPASVRAENVNGPLTVKAATGEVEASTVTGTLTVAGGAPSSARLETVSGNLDWDAGIGAQGSLEAQTVSGNVTITLPAGQGADVVVSTFSGHVDVPTSAPAPRKAGDEDDDEEDDGHEIHTVLGAGGVRISIETLSGDVRVVRK